MRAPQPVRLCFAIARGMLSAVFAFATSPAGLSADELAMPARQNSLVIANQGWALAPDLGAIEIPFPSDSDDSFVAIPAIAEQSYFRTEFLLLSRTRPRSVDVTVAQDGAVDTVVLGTNHLSFDAQTGMRFTLGHRFADNNLSFELSYATIFNEWASSASATDDNPSGGLNTDLSANFFTDSGPGAAAFDAFFDSGRQVIDYDSQFQNLELNLFRHFQPWLEHASSILAGFRFIRIAEDFAFTSFDTPTGEIGEYFISTENDLLGFQVGGEFDYAIGSHAFVTLRAKGSLFVNFTNQESRLINSDTGAGADLAINVGDMGEANLASAVELALLGRIPIGRIELHAGYEVILLSGLALAPEQFDHTIGLTGARITDRSGQIVIHGMTAGATIAW